MGQVCVSLADMCVVMLVEEVMHDKNEGSEQNKQHRHEMSLQCLN